MMIFLLLLLIVAWFLPVMMKVVRSIHMLQLNSYRNERYLKWMAHNRNKIFDSQEALYILPLLLLLIIEAEFAIIASMIIFLLACTISWRQKRVEKKKLVYTPRVKRLIVTTFGIYGVVASVAILVAAFFQMALAFIILILSAILGYYIVLVANVINRPVEARISEGFIKNAKQLLESSADLKVIGITGSFGKTSVKNFAHAVLSSKYNVLMTPESYNTTLGVTRTINEHLKPYHQIFIAEMGAKQTGDIKEICELVNQQYGILTAVGEQHLETFKTLDNIKKTKHEIVETLPEKDGVAILNKDDKNITSYQIKNPCRKIYYGIDVGEVDVRATNIEYSSKGMTFDIKLASGEEESFKTRLLGQHNVYNLLAAVAIGLEMGMTLKQIVPPVKTIQPVPHRLELKRATGNITIIDDSFNSNPVGSKMAVDVLGRMDGLRMLVTPGMIELGEKEYEINKEWARYSAEKCDYIILVGKKQTIPLQDGLKEAGYPEEKWYVADHLQDAIQQMHKVARENTIVLLENDLPDTFNE